jgi:pimeloyl-ACP methyl ester carboxylesterase
VARLRQVLNFQNGPVILAGHSYGGQIMTALGTDAPNVAGVVYIAAFGIDQGESLGALLSQGPPTSALAHLFTDQLGFGWLSHDDFVDHFAADVDPWYLVATADQAIPPDAERMLASRMGATTVGVDSSHVAMVSHPDEVTALITAAADACA